jgi:hypothetical protein
MVGRRDGRFTGLGFSGATVLAGRERRRRWKVARYDRRRGTRSVVLSRSITRSLAHNLVKIDALPGNPAPHPKIIMLRLQLPRAHTRSRPNSSRSK